MILYHGSENIIEKPEFGKGRPYNDYGQGFYCTEDILLAKEWAVDENRDGYVNCYDFDIQGMNVIDLDSDKYCILHWISVLLSNRRFELSTPLANEAYRYLINRFFVYTTDADVITGYRADDSYFSYAQDFVNGEISISQLSRAMHLGNLGKQIMIRSPRAFQSLIYKGCEGAAASEWYDRKMQRDRAAREAYRNMAKDEFIKGDLYMIRILEEEVSCDDPRLR